MATIVKNPIVDNTVPNNGRLNRISIDAYAAYNAGMSEQIILATVRGAIRHAKNDGIGVEAN